MSVVDAFTVITSHLDAWKCYLRKKIFLLFPGFSSTCTIYNMLMFDKNLAMIEWIQGELPARIIIGNIKTTLEPLEPLNLKNRNFTPWPVLTILMSIQSVNMAYIYLPWGIQYYLLYMHWHYLNLQCEQC